MSATKRAKIEMNENVMELGRWGKFWKIGCPEEWREKGQLQCHYRRRALLNVQWTAAAASADEMCQSPSLHLLASHSLSLFLLSSRLFKTPLFWSIAEGSRLPDDRFCLFSFPFFCSPSYPFHYFFFFFFLFLFACLLLPHSSTTIAAAAIFYACVWE